MERQNGINEEDNVKEEKKDNWVAFPPTNCVVARLHRYNHLLVYLMDCCLRKEDYLWTEVQVVKPQPASMYVEKYVYVADLGIYFLTDEDENCPVLD